MVSWVYSNSAGTGKPEYILTNSGHQILKWLKNYCALLKPLSSRSEDIFNGMCELYDSYLLEVFLFVGGISLIDLVWEEDLITTRLKSTLLRILKRDGNKYREEVERIESNKPAVRSVPNSQNKLTKDLKTFANRFNSVKGSSLATNGNQTSSDLLLRFSRGLRGIYRYVRIWIDESEDELDV